MKRKNERENGDRPIFKKRKSEAYDDSIDQERSEGIVVAVGSDWAQKLAQKRPQKQRQLVAPPAADAVAKPATSVATADLPPIAAVNQSLRVVSPECQPTTPPAEISVGVPGVDLRIAGHLPAEHDQRIAQHDEVPESAPELQVDVVESSAAAEAEPVTEPKRSPSMDNGTEPEPSAESAAAVEVEQQLF